MKTNNSHEDKQNLNWVVPRSKILEGNLCLRKGMWLPEEIELLQTNIKNYCKEKRIEDPTKVIFKMSKDERSDFYRAVAEGINRPLFSVYRRVIRMYDALNHIGRYTDEEVKKLQELHIRYGNNWQVIATKMGRSASSVKDRCRLIKDTCKHGQWDAEEEERLAFAVYELGDIGPRNSIVKGISWTEVAARVKTRTEKQCRSKWLNYLNWKKTSGVQWCKTDDIQLICRLTVCGVDEESKVDWNVLGRNWAACRSPYWLRGRWWHLKRKINCLSGISLREICRELFNQYPETVLKTTYVYLQASLVSQRTDIPDEVFSNSSNTMSEFVSLSVPAINFSSVLNGGKDNFNEKLCFLIESATIINISSGEVIQDGKLSVNLPNSNQRPASYCDIEFTSTEESEDQSLNSEVFTVPEKILDASHPSIGSVLSSKEDLSCLDVASHVVINDLVLSASNDLLIKEETL